MNIKNNRLAMLLMKRQQRPSRVAVHNLIESMDWCDATRSHERPVSARLAERAHSRRVLRASALALTLIATLLALATNLAPSA